MRYLIKVHVVSMLLIKKYIHKNMVINDSLCEYFTEFEFTELPSSFSRLKQHTDIMTYVVSFQMSYFTIFKMTYTSSIFKLQHFKHLT